MAVGDEIADVLERDNAEITRLKACLDDERTWNRQLVAALLLAMALITVGAVGLYAAQGPTPDELKLTEEWIMIEDPEKNTWYIDGDHLIALHDVGADDADVLGHRTVIHLPGTRIFSKLSPLELRARMVTAEDQEK